MMCMPGSLGNLWSPVPWSTALRTGLVTGAVALLQSFTPIARLYPNRYGNALIVGGITALGDAYSHPGHYGFLHAEALLTGAVSALLALVASYLLEDHARRVRAAWSCALEDTSGKGMSGNKRARAGESALIASRTAGRLSMSNVEDRLQALGYVLPEPLQLPPGAKLPFPWIRVVGNRAIISGHGPTNADGSLAEPLGKVGSQVTQEQAFVAARLAGLAILGSLKRELGSLERIACWTRAFGMVNSAPGFNRQPAVINGFTELILAVFGPERGAHARSAVGMAELPFSIPVEIEAEVELIARDA